MQTFDVLPSAHAAATHNRETNLAPEKPGQSREKFGDVMDRAMTETPREINHDDDTETPAGKRPGNPGAADPSKTTHAKNTTTSKKPLQSQPTGNGAAVIAQPIVVSASAAHISQLPEAQIALEDKGTSEDASDGDSEKGKHEATAVKSDAASKPTNSPSLTLAAALGIALPSPSAQSPVTVRGSKDAKGNSSRVSNVPAKAEAPADSPARSQTKSVEAKDSDDTGDNASAGADATAQGHLAQANDPPPAKADSAGASAIPAPDSPNTQSTKAKASVESISASASDPGGTSAAKQYLTMKKTEKTPKVAGPAEQDLPGKATGSEELPMGQKTSAQVLLHASEKAESPSTVDSSAAARISTPVESTAPTLTSTAVAPTTGVDTRLRAMERTHDIVALHAMRLSESGSDSLHVVVKPGAGIQLSLELRQNEGSIEVRASLHKGDFAHLSQYWPELQQRLEARGVRVGTLTCSENFSDTSNQQEQSSKQQEQQSPNQDPLHAGAFAEFALAGSMSEAPATRAARATAYRGWETWA